MGEVADFIENTAGIDGKIFGVGSNRYYNCHTQRDSYLRFNFGITERQYNAMFKKQKGRCCLCGMHQSKIKTRLAVDHSHKTGKVRGLLCSRCNMGLGFFKENIIVLKAAIKYLEVE